MVKQRVSYFYDTDVGHFYYGPGHPMKPHRIKMAHHLILSTGLYRKLDVYRPHLAAPLEMVVATWLVVKVAAKLIVPPVIAFPKHIISGSTRACSQANSRPLRPKPVAISSAINKTLYRLHKSAAAFSQAGL